jgi:hypothetical protein
MDFVEDAFGSLQDELRDNGIEAEDEVLTFFLNGLFIGCTAEGDDSNFLLILYLL